MKTKEYEGVRMDERQEVEEIHNHQIKHMQGMIKKEGMTDYPKVIDEDPIDDEMEEGEQPPIDLQSDETGDTKIRDLQDVRELKNFLKTKVGCPFCTNVLRIALNKREGTIACTLVAFYSVQLDEKMLIRAIKTN